MFFIYVISIIYIYFSIEYSILKIYYLSENKNKENFAKENFFFFLDNIKKNYLVYSRNILLIILLIYQYNFNILFYFVLLFLILNFILLFSTKLINKTQTSENLYTSKLNEENININIKNIYKYEKLGLIYINTKELLKIISFFILDIYILFLIFHSLFLKI
jgi:hypothetical protein